LQTVQFVPPARYMAHNIRAQNLHQRAAFEHDNPRTPIWEPAWLDLYDQIALKSAIESTFESNYRSSFNRIDGANEFRDEMLQRSQLLPTHGRVAKANVQKISTSDLVIYHRCYLHPTRSARGKEWNVLVRRYPSGSEQTAYTQYLTGRCKDPKFCRQLLERAKPIFD
jgi:hypothetical protein